MVGRETVFLVTTRLSKAMFSAIGSATRRRCPVGVPIAGSSTKGGGVPVCRSVCRWPTRVATGSCSVGLAVLADVEDTVSDVLRRSTAGCRYSYVQSKTKYKLPMKSQKP